MNPSEAPVIVDLISSVGAVGVVSVVLWWLITKWIPKLMSDFREELRVERQAIASLGERMAGELRELNTRTERNVDLILKALNSNVLAVRYLIAKLTNTPVAAASMDELICPYDGRQCGDTERCRDFKETLRNGTDARGANSPAGDTAAEGTGRKA